MDSTGANALRQAEDNLHRAVESMFASLDTKFLRSIRKESYLCSAKCCDSTGSSQEQLQNCVERCSQPMASADQHISHELDRFQGRMTTCIKVCQDKVEAEQTPSSNQQALEAKFNACALACLQDSATTGLPGVSARLEAVLKTLKQ